MSLTPDQRRTSRELGLLIDGAIAKRLALHGFHGAGFGCVARGTEPPRTVAGALAVCIEEACEPLPSDQGSEGAEQAGEDAGEDAGEGHAAIYAPATPSEELGAA